MILLSEGNFIAFYTVLISFVTSSGGRNWQHIEVYVHDLIPELLFVEEDYSANLYCGSYSPDVNWTYSNISLGRDISEYQPVSSKHDTGWKQLTLNNLKEGDSGFYTCSGRDSGHFFQLYSLVTALIK